ncbi:polyketide cyclase [Amycolatopsis sp. K13G38]|uniref:Polyketide cyclase n=1 Tax=Amycolatopsis acididurans TaxID=2724524 RepID=A0ABX1JFV2_9PSEU|nr:SRPBCC domain-containing protein [Amycolatopsis acididurans]NKQ57635.1 polyketide cyclase [Amycolatopsis acididurans]
MKPDLDLSIERIIRAPRKTVWNAWTDPDNLAQWWLPAPALCRVDRLEVRPGGGFVTRMSEDGETFVPHLNACFLVADEFERIVFTNAITSDWRPAAPEPVTLTAEITLDDHAEGTDYRILVRHGDRAAKDRHLELGFTEGWGTVLGQLARFAESVQ